MKVDLRRIPKSDKRHCRKCGTLVLYFTGPHHSMRINYLDKPHPQLCAHDHRYYICSTCCAA